MTDQEQQEGLDGPRAAGGCSRTKSSWRVLTSTSPLQHATNRVNHHVEGYRRVGRKSSSQTAVRPAVLAVSNMHRTSVEGRPLPSVRPSVVRVSCVRVRRPPYCFAHYLAFLTAVTREGISTSPTFIIIIRNRCLFRGVLLLSFQSASQPLQSKP